MLAFIFAAMGLVNSAMAAHLPALLVAAGATQAAVGAAALVGPAQVAARLAEFSLTGFAGLGVIMVALCYWAESPGGAHYLTIVRGGGFEIALVRHLVALWPGPLTTPTASAKAGLRAIARRWLDLDAEIRAHDAHLRLLTERCAPEMVIAHGMGTATAAEMLNLVGDRPERIRSEAAFAKLCGACPIPAPSGKASRHTLNRGGHRQANAALHRVVVVRMRTHQPTLDYVRRRTAEGRGKREIIRCLKRFVAREIFAYLCRPPRADRPGQIAA